LKLKAVISGGGTAFDYIGNIFYLIDYISYICVSHGISFFKYFLFSDFECYGRKKYNKILLPPSDKIISVAKIYGWKDDDIIKLNLPKWDKFNNNGSLPQLDNNHKIHNNSIFCMFTWRKIRKNKGISNLYFQNIFKLIKDKMLNDLLKENNIILYFTLHHKLNQFKEIFLLNKNIKFIEENDVFECLSKTNLVISDFSSIIFDIMYRRKPYIIYIPDLYDPEIKLRYDDNYYQLIESFKNGTIIFENKMFTVEQAVNKIKYYIQNNFRLDSRLELFYDSFDLKIGNNTNKFISYLNK
jgi:CDP-glycerol glycerophosphotransferase (TagB/SpsB family)